MKKNFTEKDWKKKVKITKREMLYAPHYKNKLYFNPWMPGEKKGFYRFLEWKFSEKIKYPDNEKKYLPEIIPGVIQRIREIPEKDFILWVGHNTFLVRVQGLYWITDPMFSLRALLPERKTIPAITAKELNSLTNRLNIIITHNHYDHLDRNSIEELHEESSVYAPLGLKNYLKSMNKNKVAEMDWWQSIKLGNGFEIICLPAQHWSRRITHAVNSTLWASFLLITPKKTFYFGGDSGYFIGYREFGKRFPNIDYAFIPTTAYHPRWFMHYAHINVDEALLAFQDIGAKYFIPTQWGTFHLGDNPVGAAAIELKNKIKIQNLDRAKFLIMDIGEIILVP